MTAEHAIPADEQLTVQYGPDYWRLHGPDDKPVLEVRNRMIYYHPAFGRWRDLPPGNRMGTDGVDCIEVRWDGGWAVGVMLPPGFWRRLVRWRDSRHLERADNAARALSELTGLPVHSEADEQQPPVVRVGASVREAPLPPPSVPGPVRPSQTAMPELVPISPVYTVEDAAAVRLPLRMGGGAQLTQTGDDRLLLTIPTETRNSSLALTLLGLVAILAFAAVIAVLRSGTLGSNPLIGLAMAGGLLIVVGLVGMFLLARMGKRLERRAIFDRATGQIILQPGPSGEKERYAVSALHGIRLRGEALKKRSKLAYHRTVSLILDSGDVPVFEETRDTALPPDPAVMPSLAALRRQADEQAGPSLARAGARVMAWFLDVPLADE